MAGILARIRGIRRRVAGWGLRLGGGGESCVGVGGVDEYEGARPLGRRRSIRNAGARTLSIEGRRHRRTPSSRSPPANEARRRRQRPHHTHSETAAKQNKPDPHPNKTR